MKPYITVESTDRSSLSDMVCEQMEKGYVPLGGVAISVITTENTLTTKH